MKRLKRGDWHLIKWATPTGAIYIEICLFLHVYNPVIVALGAAIGGLFISYLIFTADERRRILKRLKRIKVNTP